MKKFKSKKRKIKTKKRKLLKFIIFIFMIYVFTYFSFNYLDGKFKYISNKSFIDIILKTSNLTNDNNSEFEIISDAIKNVTKINFANPVNSLDEGIKNNIVKIDESADDTYDNYTELEKVTNYIENSNKNNIENPIVYLYNSHQLENYAQYNNKDENNKPNVMLTSYRLKEKLNENDIGAIVEDSDIQEILRINSWKGSSAYKASKILIEDAINKNNTLKYFIDLHRDSVGYDYTTLKTDDKIYAKFYFVIGLEHENYEKNLSFATKLSNMLNSEVSGISKGILAKKGQNVNGIYNQDINENVLLIEVGGVDNSIEEVYNSIDVLAKILIKYINEDDYNES